MLVTSTSRKSSGVLHLSALKVGFVRKIAMVLCVPNESVESLLFYNGCLCLVGTIPRIAVRRCFLGPRGLSIHLWNPTGESLVVLRNVQPAQPKADENFSWLYIAKEIKVAGRRALTRLLI